MDRKLAAQPTGGLTGPIKREKTRSNQTRPGVLWTEESFDHCFSASLGCQRGCRSTSPQNQDPSFCPPRANSVCLRTFHSRLAISYSHPRLSEPPHLSWILFSAFISPYGGYPKKPNQFPQPHPAGGDGQVIMAWGCVCRANNPNFSHRHGVGPGLPPLPLLFCSWHPLLLTSPYILPGWTWSLSVPMILAKGHWRHR